MGRNIFIEEGYSVLVVTRIIASTWYLKFSKRLDRSTTAMG